MNSPTHTRAKGGLGEDEAAAWLKQNGYCIIERNFEMTAGEIDIIARSPEGALVFAEVKAAFKDAGYDPVLRIDRRKQRQIYRVAELYLAKNNIRDRLCRFDCLSVQMDAEGGPKVTHYKDAFRG